MPCMLKSMDHRRSETQYSCEFSTFMTLTVECAVKVLSSVKNALWLHVVLTVVCLLLRTWAPHNSTTLLSSTSSRPRHIRLQQQNILVMEHYLDWTRSEFSDTTLWRKCVDTEMLVYIRNIEHQKVLVYIRNNGSTLSSCSLTCSVDGDVLVHII